MSFKTINLLPITEIARNSGIPEQYLIPYGHEVAKVDLKVIQPDSAQGKLVLVSAITPTPLGEGKTVTTIGLSQGLNFIGKKAIACIRQPSLGPVFGVKGGAAGGGKAQVLPMGKLSYHGGILIKTGLSGNGSLITMTALYVELMLALAAVLMGWNEKMVSKFPLLLN